MGLEEITCENVTPPTVAENTFLNVQTDIVKLKVPRESVDSYKAAELWKDFDIEGFEYTGIENTGIAEYGLPTAIYSLAGKKVSETQKGQVYIFRYGNGKAVKKLVK